MPDTSTAPQSATETQATQAASQTAQAVVDSQTTPAQVPADASQRAEIQKKYDALYGTQPAGTTPAVQTQVTQQVAQAPAGIDPKIVEGLTAKLAELEARLTAAQKPVETPVVKPTEADWLALLASGDKDAGEKAMAEKIKSLIGAELQANAVSQATERINAERQINDFVSEVRNKNADILVMEQAITLGAQARIQAAGQAGKIQTPSDYVTVYKEAVNAEIENARNLILSIRGQGKLEGATRVSEVIASSTLQPNQVTQSRENAQAPQTEAFDDTQTYLAKRAALKAQQQGM